MQPRGEAGGGAGPAAARGIVDVAAREGIEHLRADSVDDCC
jgi:hypothetical protein